MVRPRNIKNIKPGSCTITFEGLLCNHGKSEWTLKTKGGGRRKLTPEGAAAVLAKSSQRGK